MIERLTFPCFSLLTSRCTGPLLAPCEDGTVGLVLFTDELMLAGYRRRFKLAGPTIRFEAPGQLLAYLDVLPRGRPVSPLVALALSLRRQPSRTPL